MAENKYPETLEEAKASGYTFVPWAIPFKGGIVTKLPFWNDTPEVTIEKTKPQEL